MAAEADVPGLLPESRMVLSVDRLAFRSDLIQIHIQNGGAVQHHPNLAAFHGDFLTVPRSRGHEVPLFRCSNAIARTVVLPIFQVGSLCVGGIQDLQFHAHIRGITFGWGSDAESIVGAGSEFELKAKHKV